MATPQELQQIIREMHSGLRRITQTQESYMRELVDSLKQKDDRGSRRDSGDANGSRRDAGASKNLEKSFKSLRGEVNRNTSLLDAFGRSIQNATKALNDIQSGKSSGAPPAGSNDVSKLASQIQDLIEELRGSRPATPNRNNNTPNEDDGEAWITRLGKNIATTVGLSYGVRRTFQTALNEVQTAASRGAVYEPGRTHLDALTMGMDTTELLDLQAQHRASTLRATAGIDQWTEEVKRAQLGLLPYTGSLKEAARVTAGLQTNLMNIGFSFDQANNIIGTGNSGLIGNLKELSMVTGDTILELSNRINSLVSSDDGRDVLRKMTREQRVEYVQTQANLLRQYTQLTGNVDRATEIVQRQIAMTNRTARDRYVQSMRTAQAARLSGMSDADASELQRLMAMNPTAVLQDENLAGRLRELGGQFHQNIKTLEGSNQFATEHLGNVLARIGDVRAMEPYNIETDTGLLSPNVTQQLDRSIGVNIESNEILLNSFNVLNQIQAGLQNLMTMLAAGAIANAIRSFSVLKDLKNILTTGGATRGAGAAGSTATRSLMSTVGNVFKSPKVLGGIAGGIAVASGMAIDKFYTPTSSNEERGKNTASTALEYAGYGMMIGTVIAGPIGAAVGAAVGGLAGAVVGLNKTVQEQALYDAHQQLAEADASMMLIKSRHQMEVDRINTLIEAEQTRIGETQGAERQLHQQRLDALREQLEKEKSLYEVRLTEAQNLRNITDALATKLQEKHDLRLGFESGFSRNWWIGKEEFDPSDFMEKSKWSATDLIQSISDTMADQISASDFSRLQQAILNDDDINDGRLLEILRGWRDRLTDKTHKEAEALKQQQLEQFLKTKQASQQTTIITDDNRVQVVDNVSDLYTDKQYDQLRNTQVRDDRIPRQLRSKDPAETAISRDNQAYFENAILAAMESGSSTYASPTSRRNPSTAVYAPLEPKTTPMSLSDYAVSVGPSSSTSESSQIAGDAASTASGMDATPQMTIEDVVKATMQTTIAIEQLTGIVDKSNRDQMTAHHVESANRAFENNIVTRRGVTMPTRSATLPK